MRVLMRRGQSEGALADAVFQSTSAEVSLAVFSMGGCLLLDKITVRRRTAAQRRELALPEADRAWHSPRVAVERMAHIFSDYVLKR